MITEADARKAAFWDQTICLDCGSTEGDVTEECENCGGAHVLQGKLILVVLESVQVGEET